MRVTGADWTRLGDAADRVAHFLGHRAYLRMTDGHCAALALRPARDGTNATEFFCTLYERRPQVCRDLARGAPACAAELARKAPWAARAAIVAQAGTGVESDGPPSRPPVPATAGWRGACPVA